MQTSTHINDFIASLPKIRKRRIWTVMIDGVAVQAVSATDNRKSTAERYIAGKYPGKSFQLVNPVAFGQFGFVPFTLTERQGMLPNDIEWFDGMDANGKIVLEIVYRDNGKGYLKGSLDQIYDHYNIMADCPKVAELVIYNVDGKEMVRKVCLSNLV